MDFLSKVYNKVITLFDFFNLEIVLFYFSIAIFVLLLEAFVLGWNKSSFKKIINFSSSVKTDVIFFFLDAFNIYGLITVLISFGIIHFLTRMFYEATNFNLIVTIDNPYLQFGILFFISDLKQYFSHLIFHRYNSLWKLHEFHHSASEFCVLTRYRGHFLETALKKFIDVIPFAIFGASIQSYFIIKVFVEVHQLIIHSGIQSTWGFIGKYIFVSPADHRLHHSIKRKHYEKNFGSTFIFWDRIFGTYCPSEEILAIGVDPPEYNKKGFIYDTYLGLRNFLAALGIKKR